MNTQDQGNAVLVAVANWLNQLAQSNPGEFGGQSPGERVDVLVADLGGEAPRIELYVGRKLIGHTQLARSNPTAAN